MGLLDKMSGSKPKLPGWTPINITGEQQATVAGNLSTLPQATELASGVNTFNQSELDRIYNQALPGYDRIKQNVADYLASTTRGQIPEDVANEVYRRATSQATASGFGGSGMGRNLTARDLGLTSLDLMGRGIDSTQRWLSTQAAPRFDVTSMFLTPAQRIPMAMEERNLKFQYDYLKAQIKAMPDPETKYWTDGVTTLLMGAGNMWGADYNTASPSEWGGKQAPQMNTGGGGGGFGGGGSSYTPQNQYGYQNYGNYQGWSGYSQPPVNTGYDPSNDVSYDSSSYGGIGGTGVGFGSMMGGAF
jgi:hypothetical protein